MLSGRTQTMLTWESIAIEDDTRLEKERSVIDCESERPWKEDEFRIYE
jgi:hypothetical protein